MNKEIFTKKDYKCIFQWKDHDKGDVLEAQAVIIAELLETIPNFVILYSGDSHRTSLYRKLVTLFRMESRSSTTQITEWSIRLDNGSVFMYDLRYGYSVEKNLFIVDNPSERFMESFVNSMPCTVMINMFYKTDEEVQAFADTNGSDYEIL